MTTVFLMTKLTVILCYLTVLISILAWHDTDGGQDMILLKENKKEALGSRLIWVASWLFPLFCFSSTTFQDIFIPHLSDRCYKLKFRISREAHKWSENQKYECYLKQQHSFCVWLTWFTLRFSCSSSSTDKPTLAERILEVPKSYIYIPDRGLCTHF